MFLFLLKRVGETCSLYNLIMFIDYYALHRKKRKPGQAVLKRKDNVKICGNVSHKKTNLRSAWPSQV